MSKLINKCLFFEIILVVNWLFLLNMDVDRDEGVFF